MALSYEANDDALCGMHEDIRSAHDFSVAIALLTETLDKDVGLVVQRLARSAIAHIGNIERSVDNLRLANAAVEARETKRHPKVNLDLAAS